MELSSRTNQATRSVPGRHTRCTFIVYILFVLEMVYLFHSTQNNQRVFLYVVYVVGGHVFRSRLPLPRDLPEFLSALGVGTPSVGIAFDIFIRQYRLECPTPVIEIQDIFDQEPVSAKCSNEEFVHPFIDEFTYCHQLSWLWGSMPSHNHTRPRQPLT